MAISAVFDGYVVENPEEKDGEYGRYTDIILKVNLGGREIHYAQGRFYGRKITLILDFVRANEYMTMTGSVSRIMPRVRKDGVKCCHIYLRDAFLTLPPKLGFSPAFKPELPKGYNLDEGIDNSPPSGDDELSL
jgi:hypothetical protein